METFGSQRIKWPYATHLVDRAAFTRLLPVVEEENPGALLLGRVVAIGRHKDLESVDGRRIALFRDDLFVGTLGHRYATDQFEGAAVCRGPMGHILSIGGVCGEVVTKNERMAEPTVVEWLGRLSGDDGAPLHLRDFRRSAVRPLHAPRPRIVLSLGASMNAGKTTTAAQLVRSLTAAGHRVSAAKITGTACRKDPSLLEDAGAERVLDFTWAGWPSTAGCSRDELLATWREITWALRADQPDTLVYEIADGIVQRETRMLLEDPLVRESVDAVTYAAPDSLSCESGVRMLRGMGYTVLATAGPVANSPLGRAEVEAMTQLPCLCGEQILGGALVPALDAVKAA
jgi:hypothetical protein